MKVRLVGAQLFHAVKRRDDVQTRRSYELFEILLTRLKCCL